MKAIDITFDDSTADFLKLALYFLRKDTQMPSLDNKDDFMDKARRHRVFQDIQDYGYDVRYFSLHFDIGHLVGEKNRWDYVRKYFSGLGWISNKHFYNQQMNNIKKIIACAKKGYVLRLWYGYNAFSLCGVYYLINALKDINAKIILLPYKSKEEKGTIPQMDLTVVYKMIVDSFQIDDEDKAELIEDWEKLVEDNAALRICNDGEITSVDESYFDPIIEKRRYIARVPMRRMVGDVLGHTHHYITDFFIESRIRKMIDDGKIVVVDKKKDDLYIEWKDEDFKEQHLSTKERMELALKIIDQSNWSDKEKDFARHTVEECELDGNNQWFYWALLAVNSLIKNPNMSGLFFEKLATGD